MSFTIEKTSPGRTVEIGGGLVAYLPPPLPPDVPWSAELVESLAEAARAIGEINGAGRLFGRARSPRMLRYREAVASSGIEGTTATTTDLALFEFEGGATERGPRDTREVSGYLQAHDLIMGLDLDRPFALALVRELHAILMKGSDANAGHAGRFREKQNFVTSAFGGVARAAHVPPPPLQMRDALVDWERFAVEARTPHALVRHALLHYQFECIHPFEDGNGRVGRLLAAYFMRRDGLLDASTFSLSVFLERHRSEYYERLGDVTRRGRWADWIAFYLRGVREQATEAVRRSRDLDALRERYRARLRKLEAPANALALLERLFFDDPVVTATSAAPALGVAFQTAQNAIERCVEAGILHEVTGQRRNRVYLARGILEGETP